MSEAILKQLELANRLAYLRKTGQAQSRPEAPADSGFSTPRFSFGMAACQPVSRQQAMATHYIHSAEISAVYSAGNILDPEMTQHASKGHLCSSERKVTPSPIAYGHV